MKPKIDIYNVTDNKDSQPKTQYYSMKELCVKINNFF